MEEKICMSCKKRISNIAGSTEFKCPKCGDHQMIRCGSCRTIAAPYKCPKCGFEGPN
ncbi:zinc finger domain-containing protein [Nanoarchaeota archaeon]